MRILLTSNASFVPPRGGSTRSNRVWLEYLAWRGHLCRVVCAAAPAATPEQLASVEREARNQGFLLDPARDDIELSLPSGIRVSLHRDLARRPGVLASEIRAFRPDWVLVSSEDIGHSLLREADEAAPGRVVYLAHTPQFLPFGPESWSPDPHASARVRHAAAVVVIGHHMAAYVQEHLGRPAHVIHPRVYGSGPFESLAKFDQGFILMVNPCAVKGISLFADTARALPDLPFAALPGWGTTTADRATLAAIPNITLLEPVRHIEQVLERARLLLMPSLWYEGFGLIVMEAMLRGIPVISSDSGGLLEAKNHTGYVLPVAPIRLYLPAVDEVHMPRPVIPPQDTAGWIAAVRELLGSAAVYERESERSQEVALDFVYGLRPSAIEDLLLSLEPRKPRPLRILLAHNSLYFPSHGGGDKSNRLLMEALAARCHEVQVLARLENFGETDHARFLAELEARQTPVESIREGVVGFTRNGVSVFTVTSNPRLRNAFSRRIEEFDPDIILCSTDDPGALLLEVALRYPRARVVYLVRATVAVPFGPDCAFPNASKTEMIGCVDSIVGVSEYVAQYVREWSSYPAIHVPISLLEPGDYSDMGRFDNEFVLMVNPCAVKGISIFTELAGAMPDVPFAAIPTWGTNPADLELLKRFPNIRLFEPVDDIAVVLRRTRVVLVPSVWAEARSRMVVEAMIRGIPVMASDVGGLHEAKLGIEYLLPVNPILHYQARVDANMVPVAEVPLQDIGPWQAALRRLLTDRAHYEDVSRRSRAAALEYADKLHAGWLEAHLEELIRKPKRESSAATLTAATAIESLSPAKRRLLALRVFKRNVIEPRPQGSSAFPDLAALSTYQKILFAFPWAGGGTSFYRTWQSRIGETAGICPIRLPGRESRLSESPFTDIHVLVGALLAAIRSHLDRPFAFYGHSMGAGIAFELTRALRREGLPMPSALFVSSARAPQLRTEPPPGQDPTDDELIRQLESLGDPIDNPDLLRLALPALRADTYLYRHYLYQAEAPLNLPVHIFGGSEDPSLTRGQLEAWREQTTGPSSLTLFPAGHFFFRRFENEFLEALRRDLRP